MRIVSNEEMTADKTAIESIGIPSVVLMENAGPLPSISEYCKQKNYQGEIRFFAAKVKMVEMDLSSHAA